jgi:putative acetyltransferase
MPDPEPVSGTPVIVPFDEAHAASVLEVIGTVFREYAMTFDPSGFDADLRDVRRYYAEHEGAFWVLEDGSRVVGTVAVVSAGPDECEVKRLYLLPGYRGRGFGRVLVEQVLDWAATSGRARIVAWSDVRLATAHAVYERMGFIRFGERTVQDIDRSREVGFALELQP